MINYHVSYPGMPGTISDRLIQLRNRKNMTLADVAKLFHVNKSTVLRWETKEYWEHHDTPTKRLLLLQLVELYQADYGWVMHGKTGKDSENTNILIIDDDKTSLSIMTLIIKSFISVEFKLFSFTEPEKGLEWARNNPAAMVFCDYRMPGMKGDTFIRKLLEIQNYKSTPIIAITQVREAGLSDKLLDAGATHVLQKPIDHDKLQDILKPYDYS